MRTSDDPPFFINRIKIFYLFLILSFGIILNQLFTIQIKEGPYYQSLSKKNRVRVVNIPAPRGRIFDRHGQILVDNRPRKDLIATIEDIIHPKNVAHMISKLLKIDEDKILPALKTRTSPLPYEPSLVLPDLSQEEMIKISEFMYQLPGVDIQIKPVRHYIHNSLACHLLGYTGDINQRELKRYVHKSYNRNDEIGKQGIEKTMEDYLRGQNGVRQIQINSRGQFDKALNEKMPIHGNDVYLTIDLEIQKVLEEQFFEKRGAGIAMEVQTGEILALGSFPNYNPNDFSTGNSRKISKYFTHEEAPLLNRAIAAEFAPGSIFKPIVALAGLKAGLITQETTKFCNGQYKLGDITFRCWRKWGHGETDVLKSIEQSCNVYYYHIGKEISPNQIFEMGNYFGLGQLTKIPLPGERKGILPSTKWKKQRWRSPGQGKWHLGDTINYSIGQGYLLVTPLQVVRYTAGLANGKELPYPKLIKKITSPHHKDIPYSRNLPPPTLEVQPSHLAQVQAGMTAVVNSRYGTGRKARIKGISVAGKTGTAQVKTKDGEIKNTWFISYAPTDNPQIACAILVENAESGGLNAAPIAQAILAKYFNLQEKELQDHHPVITTVDEETPEERDILGDLSD